MLNKEPQIEKIALHLYKTILNWSKLIFMGPGRDRTRDPVQSPRKYGTGSRVRSRTFVEIDHEIISTVILLPSADSFKKGCCQLQAKVCAQNTG